MNKFLHFLTFLFIIVIALGLICIINVQLQNYIAITLLDKNSVEITTVFMGFFTFGIALTIGISGVFFAIHKTNPKILN